MIFHIDQNSFDQDVLRCVGAGIEAQVYDLGFREQAAKIYWSSPTPAQQQKLVRLFDIGRELDQDENIGRLATLPLSPALANNDAQIVGFSMRFLEGFTPLSYLRYNQAAQSYQSSDGFQFNDNSAVEAVKKMFAVLNKLAKRHISIGDISMQNILVNVRTGCPAFVDMDSVNLEGFVSASPGTEGYTDPRLLDMDVNSEGGLHFDQSSDIFALTVVAYTLLVGIMPHMLATNPALSNLDEYVKRGINHIRVLRDGFRFLARHGLQLVDRSYVDYVSGRLEELRSIRGSTGQDGELLVQYFEDVFVGGRRENFVESLNGDEWDSVESILIRTGGRQALDELAQRFNVPDPRIIKKTQPSAAIDVPRSPRRSGAYVCEDPPSLRSFCLARGIDLAAIVS